jgi:hypothetical protein
MFIIKPLTILVIFIKLQEWFLDMCVMAGGAAYIFHKPLPTLPSVIAHQ